MAGLMLQLALMFLVPMLILGIIAKSNMGPWAIFLAVLAAAGLFLLVQTQSK